MKLRYSDLRFQADSLALIDDCNAVVERYQAQDLTLTLRQLYYQLVVTNTLPNAERAYKRLGNVVSRGRLAGLIDWSAIEDRTRQPRQASAWDNPAAIMRAAILSYRLPRWAGQQDYVEKDALAGVLEPITDDHHVTLMVNRGYSSQSAMYDAASRFEEASGRGQQSTVLYLGDLDPSGEDMVRDIDARLNDVFSVLHGVHVEKLAITPEQVALYNPPPNPAKLSDSRAGRFIAEHGSSSYEVDALPPEVLQRIVSEAIDQHVDHDVMSKVLDQEETDRRLLERGAQRVMEERDQ